ncbi:hypothetical protein Adt_36488 [Abeliophyllum distichum]|uniref:Uncharacterized protein n=1 Tax=Abeliophyllum distichum TaxID=126358 RepID=A0ABD1QHQ9_9LAMI
MNTSSAVATERHTLISIFSFTLTNIKYNHSNHHSCPFSFAHLSPQATEDDLMTMNLVRTLEKASPNLPVFGKSPMVRKLRITDSLFPLQDFDDDNRIDEAAEKFIMKFYHEGNKLLDRFEDGLLNLFMAKFKLCIEVGIGEIKFAPNWPTVSAPNV